MIHPRKEQKAKQRRHRIRQEKHQQKFGALPAAAPVTPSPYASEQTLRKLHRVLEGKDFANKDELNQYLNSLVSSGALNDDAAPDDPKEQAQEFAYRALEASSPKEALSLARSALELDPDCLDALRIEATIGQTRPAFMLVAIKKVVRKGEQLLGPEFFDENRGHFWGITETRPFMRALADLAQAHRYCRQDLEAIRVYQRMLELNPNDNQGIRDSLVVLLLANDWLEPARQLFKEYPEAMAIMSWARVLERFLSQDLEGAARELATARESNPYVEAYLSGRKRLPRTLSSSYGMGDESEAQLCASEFEDACKRHPAWLEWLRQQVI